MFIIQLKFWLMNSLIFELYAFFVNQANFEKLNRISKIKQLFKKMKKK